MKITLASSPTGESGAAAVHLSSPLKAPTRAVRRSLQCERTFWSWTDTVGIFKSCEEVSE